MHGGCRVLNFGGGCFATGTGSDNSSSYLNPAVGHSLPNTMSFEEDLQEGRVASRCTKSFTEHESMAYGTDWLVCPHPTQNGYFEAAARCVGHHRPKTIFVLRCTLTPSHFDLRIAAHFTIEQCFFGIASFDVRNRKDIFCSVEG